MAASSIKFFYGTESEILALTSTSVNWIESAFYYPNDKDYFYQIQGGVMKKYGSGENSTMGVTVNYKYLSGIKNKIYVNEIMNIPVEFEYNVFKLTIDGIVNVSGNINFM